ncbi:hypothetical protein HU175_24100 [Spirosoma sp. KUDC1026]|nr:hypothetical protein HU175_24100 [Spirosoma sp. KUDC1026]
MIFPDTISHFAPYRVEDVATFTTQTTGTGAQAISRDSAVYTLVSFETDSIQLLRVPIRIISANDCTALYTAADTVFLRSRLPQTDSTGLHSFTLATETTLTPLRQQFNYPLLVSSLLVIGVLSTLLFILFRQPLQRLWWLSRLDRHYRRFQQQFNRLSRSINAQNAADNANQAVILWKSYLEELDGQSYTSLTTSELAERFNEEKVTAALRDADLMIYGNVFLSQSQSSLQVLSDLAERIYQRRRREMQSIAGQPTSAPPETSEASSALTP